MNSMALTLCAVAAAVILANGEKPHIVFVMADDFGWNNLGIHAKGQANEKEARTPRLDALVNEGVLLDRHYAFRLCSPSRSAFHSGRNPIHVNVFNSPLADYNLDDPVSGFAGIPRNMTGIAEKLAGAGYFTVATGKWDVGLATPDHTPHGRGFNRSLVYLSAANDYWTNLVSGGPGDATQGFCGTSQQLTDLWQDDAPAFGLNNSWACSQAKQAGCLYEDERFNEFAVNAIRAHDPSTPLFLYYAPHAVHAPLEVPAALLANFSSFIDDNNRAHYAALANSLDTLVGNVVDALVAQGLWDNTLLVLSSDNGGPVYLSSNTNGPLDGSGNNWPLHGGKISNWEGGIRVNAFASGGFIPPARRGTIEPGFAAIEDWYATFCSLAGVDPTDTKAAAAGLPPIDSLDLWPLISGANATSPRTEVVIGAGQLNESLVQGLIRADGWKLLRGGLTMDFWQGPLYPNASTPINISASYNKWCGEPEGPEGDHCLFNVLDDPNEHVDQSAAHPEIIAELARRIREHERTVFSPNRGSVTDLSCTAANTVLGGFIGPFLP